MRKELDILKAFAVLAVILLHFNSNLFNRWNNALIFDQIVRFCVPLFVALSGYTLAAKYLVHPFNLKSFYLRRVTKLLPWYFLWSVLIYITLKLVPGWSTPNWQPLWYAVDYHLYFVPMIFQLYLIFPLLFLATKKFKWLPLLITLILQSVIFTYFANNPQWSDQEQYIFGGSWVFFFELGIYLSQKENYVKKTWWLFLLIILFLIGSLVWEIKDAFYLLSQKVDVIVAAKSTRFSVMSYGTSVVLLGVLFREKLTMLPGLIVNALVFLGKKSYLIYLFHTLVLRVIFEPQHNPNWDYSKMIEVLLIVGGGIILSDLPNILSSLRANAKQSSQ